MHVLPLFSIIDFLGVLAGALGGAVAAKHHERYHYDIVGVFGLALVCALGGGIARDILIEHGPPLAFVDVRYLYTAFGGSLIGLLLETQMEGRTKKILLFLDATALAFFAVAGATRALNAGLTALPALILGVVTAVGGGSLRDVLSGTTPRVFERGELYAIIAVVSASTFLICNYLGFSRISSTSVGVSIGFLLRLLTLRFRWQTKAVR